jgi:hypothetical protein
VNHLLDGLGLQCFGARWEHSRCRNADADSEHWGTSMPFDRRCVLSLVLSE